MRLEELLQIAVQKKASDLHLTANLPAYLRIDGQLKKAISQPLGAKEVQILAFSILSSDQKTKFLKEKELDTSFEISSGHRFRINIMQEKGAVGLAARVIPEKIPTMEELRLPEIVHNLIGKKQGLILMTGPTGCGKSTSLASMIDNINQNRAEHIVTLEDPVEFLFKSQKSVIKQRELGPDMVSFADGLKHVLRQDPNVVMVGEMRDLETVASAVTLAETGHLILATLHTYSAAQAIDRIIDIFPSHQQAQIRLQVSMTLLGVISQRLLPKSGGGRVAAREILLNNPAVANLVRENKTAQLKSVIQTGVKEGMISMDNSLKSLVKENLIDQETAKVYASYEW